MLNKSKASYNRERKRVLVYDFDNKEMFYHILYHEIGHYVFYNIINGFVRKKWVTQISKNSPYVTKYAAVNASEDFAETYATFILKPAKLYTLGQKLSFMRQEIFKGYRTDTTSLLYPS